MKLQVSSNIRNLVSESSRCANYTDLRSVTDTLRARREALHQRRNILESARQAHAEDLQEEAENEEILRDERFASRSSRISAVANLWRSTGTVFRCCAAAFP